MWENNRDSKSSNMEPLEYISDSDSSDEDPGVLTFSPPVDNPRDNKSSADSGEECGSHSHDETSSYSSQAASINSSQSKSSGYSSQTSRLYEPPAASSKKRSFDNGYDKESDSELDSQTQYFASEESPIKKPKYDFDDFAQKNEPEFQFNSKVGNMMAGMGYKSGKGLGKNEQGRVDPIELSKQQGRRGLGRVTKGLEPESLTWDSSREMVSEVEKPEWLDCFLQELTPEDMKDWIVEGPKIMEMDSFCDYVDPELLFKILEKKTVFDDLDEMALNSAVKRANPFESIKHGIFQNRAAMKMANMDKVFSRMFTNPLDQNNKPLIGEKNLLYFADVCAGPGGFSEYVLYKRQWQAKGIGFTLRKCNDFKIDEFLAGTPESFETYYGVKGDGDVYDPENIDSLREFVMMKTDGVGVHFMMADGGFSVSGQENIQELLSKRLYLCQFLVALSIVRTGGHFVCKLFDVFSPFSVGLVYLMYRSFDSICLHKPNTSRPANSERYIICKYKRSDCDAIREYMYQLNLRLEHLDGSGTDINECVPMSELKGDTKFFDYIVNSNNSLGERQLLYLVKTIVFCKNTSLTEPKQAELCVKCLNYWEVENETRKIKEAISADAVARQTLKDFDISFANTAGVEIKHEHKLKQIFPSILDWKCIPITEIENCFFYLGCGKQVYVWKRRKWARVENVDIELSPGTLVYAEVTDDVKGEFKAQTRMKILHIIDAISLGKKNIVHRSYNTRIELCKLYAKALHKSWRDDSEKVPIPLRVNNFFDLENFMHIFSGIEIRTGKKPNEILYHVRDDKETRESFSENYFCPIKGILFYKLVKAPWLLVLSSRRRYEYFNTKNGKSYPTPPECVNANAVECFMSRRVWNWGPGVGVRGEDPMEEALHHRQLKNYIDEYLNKHR